ncbi:MAG: methyltransferase domain-containing protein, partial [Betaproteobacteria bacterium]|nr:methyltransferase domain-containing protein [Betaproteobacteria bacterium]
MNGVAMVIAAMTFRLSFWASKGKTPGHLVAYDIRRPSGLNPGAVQCGCFKARRSSYLTPDVVKQRELAIQRLAPQPGERVLDIGCGPGLTTLALAESVGPQGLVHAVDIAEPMLALARSRCASQSRFTLSIKTLPGCCT